MLNPAIAKIPMPDRFRKLPLDHRGYPVPKFVTWIDGKADFRVVDARWFQRARHHRLCWLCGERLGGHLAFVIGPMCAINRTTTEPPSHLDCARFAVQACPFITHPNRKRDETNLPEGCSDPGGEMIMRNPGVALIWVARSYQPFQAPDDGGMLFRIGPAVSTEWWARGRHATRAEIMHSIETGLPILRKIATEDGPAAVAQLESMIKAGLELVPEDVQ
jgi:hypothetical protein